MTPALQGKSLLVVVETRAYRPARRETFLRTGEGDESGCELHLRIRSAQTGGPLYPAISVKTSFSGKLFSTHEQLGAVGERSQHEYSPTPDTHPM
jgi:hypothetical protein